MIYALPGFLGLQEDWKPLELTNLSSFSWEQFPLTNFSHWASSFNAFAAHQNSRPKILMGYSLGGRLALTALIDQPTLWDGAVIISAHPGLTDENERKTRQTADIVWAERFQNEKWESLMKDWSDQKIFLHDQLLVMRKEENYQRDHLSAALVNFSLGKQNDLRKKIAQLPQPLLWISGSLDTHFSEIAKTLNFSHPHSRICQVEGAGHRVHLTHPLEVARLIREFETKPQDPPFYRLVKYRHKFH